jgi:hypothetical protein
MAYTYSGYARSLTVRITDGAANTYTIYSGLNGFVWNGKTYASITANAMASMALNDFNQRVQDFKSYLTDAVPGLNFTTGLTQDARIENPLSCPIGENA